MEVFDGGTYRINIAGEDSSIIINSDTSQITGDLMNRKGTVLVDADTNTLHGNLSGNIVDPSGHVVYDSVKQTISAIIKSSNGTISYDPANQHFYGVMQGSIKDDQGVVRYESAGSVFNGKFRGEIINENEKVILDTKTGRMDISFLRADEIEGNIFADVHGSVMSYNNSVIVDAVNNTVSAKLIGSLYADDQTKVIDAATRSIYARNISVNKILTNEDFMIFGNNNADMFFRPGDGGIAIQQTFSSLDMQADCLKFNSRFEHGNIDPGMLVSHIITEGWIDSEYRESGHLFFMADPTSKITNDSKTIPTVFGVYVSDGREQKPFDEMFNKSMTFDHRGTLQAPVIQTGTTIPKRAKKGMIVFNDKTGKFQGYTGDKWVDLNG